jgi:hypothetical protein
MGQTMIFMKTCGQTRLRRFPVTLILMKRAFKPQKPQDLQANRGLADNQPGYRTSPIRGELKIHREGAKGEEGWRDCG